MCKRENICACPWYQIQTRVKLAQYWASLIFANILPAQYWASPILGWPNIGLARYSAIYINSQSDKITLASNTTPCGPNNHNTALFSPNETTCLRGAVFAVTCLSKAVLEIHYMADIGLVLLPNRALCHPKLCGPE